MNDTSKLTTNQQTVLAELRKIGRDRAFMYAKDAHLHTEDCKKLVSGDASCVFGMGALSWQVGRRLEMTAARVLCVFKQLERKGLVIRETHNPTYKRPLYWWPVGLAAELVAELGLKAEAKP